MSKTNTMDVGLLEWRGKLLQCRWGGWERKGNYCNDGKKAVMEVGRLGWRGKLLQWR